MNDPGLMAGGLYNMPPHPRGSGRGGNEPFSDSILLSSSTFSDSDGRYGANGTHSSLNSTVDGQNIFQAGASLNLSVADGQTIQRQTTGDQSDFALREKQFMMCQYNQQQLQQPYGQQQQQQAPTQQQYQQQYQRQRQSNTQQQLQLNQRMYGNVGQGVIPGSYHKNDMGNYGHSTPKTRQRGRRSSGNGSGIMHPGIPELGAYGSDSQSFQAPGGDNPGVPPHMGHKSSGWPLQQRVSNPNLNIPRGGGGQGRSNKQLRGSHSDSLLLNVKNLEDDTLVDIVCKSAKKVMLEASARKNRANSKVAGLRDRDSLELMGENNHPLDPYAEPPSLKAVELANALRSKLGVYILGHVRDVFGGLLNLLEKQPHVFRVVRIPKNDHVILLEGPTPSTSHGVLPTPRDNPSPAITLEQEFSPHGSNESGGSAVYGSMAYQGVQQQQQPVSQQAQYPYAYDNAPSVPRSSPFSNAPSPQGVPQGLGGGGAPPVPSPLSVGVYGNSGTLGSSGLSNERPPDSVFVGHGLDGVLDGLDPGTWMVSEPAADRRSTAEVSSAFFPGLLSGLDGAGNTSSTFANSP